MSNKLFSNAEGAGFICAALIAVTCSIGYGLNIVKLFGCDFEAPYKAEVIRIIGIPVAPVGMIAGYLDLGE